MGKYASRNNTGKHAIAKDDPAAIRLLKEEHHIFRELFDEFEEVDRDRQIAIARELNMRLTVHMVIEEEILYPALKNVISDDEVNEGIVEHQSGKRIITELEQLDGNEELFSAKVHVLGEETVHHIDEEDDELFDDAVKAHDSGAIDLDHIGENLRTRQKALYDEISRWGEVGRTCETNADEVPQISR